MNSRPSRASAVAAGLALILLPLLAIVVKILAFPGWMLFIMITLSPALVLGYTLQVVISANGFLRERGVFGRMPGAVRGIVAAWVTSVGVVLTAFFLVDGGDDGEYGSAFTALVGLSSTASGEGLSMTFFLIAAAIWLAGYLWLVIEWIVQLVRARATPPVAA